MHQSVLRVGECLRARLERLLRINQPCLRLLHGIIGPLKSTLVVLEIYLQCSVMFRQRGLKLCYDEVFEGPAFVKIPLQDKWDSFKQSVLNTDLFADFPNSLQ